MSVPWHEVFPIARHSFLINKPRPWPGGDPTGVWYQCRPTLRIHLPSDAPAGPMAPQSDGDPPEASCPGSSVKQKAPHPRLGGGREVI